MEEAEKSFFSILRHSEDQYKLFYNVAVELIPFVQAGMRKSKQLSEEARKLGNDIFVKKLHSIEDHKAIFELYNKSIALASPGSEELASAFGNRSAFLMHIDKDKESIEDIDRAVEITATYSYKVKLLCRKAKVLQTIDLSQVEDVIKEAKEHLDDMPWSDMPLREEMTELLEKTESNFIFSCQQQEENLDEKISSLNLECPVQESKGETEINEEMDIFSSISVKYNWKFGKHVVANRDFKPGEVVYVENCYAGNLKLEKKYFNCNHCLKSSWTLIPCDGCSLVMYCSTKCRDEAFIYYHRVECAVAALTGEDEPVLFENRLTLCLLLHAIEQVDGIANLRNVVRNIDNEIEINEIFTDKIFEKKFIALYKLDTYAKTEIDSNPFNVATSIILMKVLLFRDQITFFTLEEVFENEDALFIGALFLKIVNANSFWILPHLKDMNDSSATEAVYPLDFYHSAGSGLGLISNLINYSCVPNVSRVTEDGKKMIIFALQPIKAGSTLFDSYQSSFYHSSKTWRSKRLDKYWLICGCEACKDNWPCYNLTELQEAMREDFIKINLGANLSGKMLEIEKIVEEERINNNQFAKVMKGLSGCIFKALQSLILPSKTVCYFHYLLQKVYNNLYDAQKLNFEECEDSNNI